MNYNEIVLKIIEERGWNGLTPASLVRRWEKFVDDCQDGYSSNIYEFDNELYVRDKLEYLLSSPELLQFKEYIIFKNIVDNIDKKLKNLFDPNYKRNNDERWWWKGILKYAGEEYSLDVESLYDIKPKEIE